MLSLLLTTRGRQIPMVLICVFVSTEGPAEPAKCGHLVFEREPSGGAAEIPAALG